MQSQHVFRQSLDEPTLQKKKKVFTPETHGLGAPETVSWNNVIRVVEMELISK